MNTTTTTGPAALPATSAELLAFLRTHGASTAAEVHAALSPCRPRLRPRDTERRMGRLRALGWIDYEITQQGAMLWYASGKAMPAAMQRRYAAVRPANAAPPPQYDVMNGPPYTGTPAQAARPGALQFLQFASRGYRC